jgi:hypothetical protein
MPLSPDDFQKEKHTTDKTQSSHPQSFLNFTLQSHIFNRKRTRIFILIVGCVLITVWQSLFLFNNSKLDTNYQIRDVTGLQHWVLPRFFYFYYYLGLYPMAPENKDNLVYSKEGAKREISENGDNLLMEIGHCIRSGDHGKIWLYLPDAFIRGNVENPDVRLCHAFFFTLALIILFISFWWVGQPLLGTITIMLLGSNPFQLFEVYTNENTFGWAISIALITLGLHLPIFTNKKRSPYYLWTIPILTGIILGTVRQIRTEPMIIIVSAALSYLVISETRRHIKISLVILLVLFFSLTSYGWKSYFDYKFKQAYRVVKEAEGHPIPQEVIFSLHPLWHNLWLGLGDFDKKYGYAWDDTIAADYAFPILKKKYNMKIKRRPEALFGQFGRLLDDYWDKDKKYYRMVEHLPRYFDVLRDKVIFDITHDPMWYLDIILKRVWRVFSETTPIRISLGRRWVTLPMHGLFLIPMMLILIAGHNWMLLKLICFTLPLAFAAIVICSEGGMSFYSCYHIFVVAICIAWLTEGGLLWYYKNKGLTLPLND